jgi:RNA polymerase sigma-70 factor (ECF subfamily)
LVAAILQRDRKAAAHFVAAHADAVYGYVKYRLAPRGDRVEDLVQEVFVAALDGLASFQASSSLRTWLLGIARHKVESYYREQLRQLEPLDDQLPPPAADLPPIEETLERAQIEARTRAVMQRLTEPYRAALFWRYWDGSSVREIAAATGKTEKAVERLLARARARFRELWEQHQP